MRTVYSISRLLCLATLILAFAKSVSCQEPNRDDSPPSIVLQPLPTVIDTRVPLVLHCRAEGTPPPMYYWKKNGVVFDVDQEERFRAEDGDLIIENPSEVDNGEYQCFANNQLGTAMSDKVDASLLYLMQFPVVNPITITAVHGQSEILRCGQDNGPPDGFPEPVIYWTDSSGKPQPIVYDARVSQDPNGNLVFSNVNASDAKGYYCTAVNYELGESKRSPLTTLVVDTSTTPSPIQASLVSKPSASVVALRNKDLKLKCIASGYPTPSIIWKRGGERLQSGERRTIDNTGQGLTISNIEFNDAGQYTCEATNSAGSDAATTVVTVEAAPYFPNPPSDETKGPGEEVSITCRAEGVPSPQVDWLVNGEPWEEFAEGYVTGDRWTVITGQNREASITITGLVTADSNVFQCLASNMYKESLTSVVLNVVAIPARILQFTPESGMLTVLQSSSATFICHKEGRPAPDIIWTYKQTTLTDTDKYTIDDVEGSLTIHNVLEEDSGRYICTVHNEIDGNDYEDTHYADLQVIHQTEIATPPEDRTVREGDDALFQCEISYDPLLEDSPPEVHWENGGNRLAAAEDGSLTVPATTVASSGAYICVVETSVDGEIVHVVNSTAILTVQGRPSPPHSLSLQSQERQFYYRLMFEPGNSNNDPITNFFVQFDTIWEDMRWVFKDNLTADNTDLYTAELFLDPYVQYKFRVIARNSLGDSEPSQILEMTDRTASAPPTRNPVGVTATSTDPTTMVVRWKRLHPYYYGGPDYRYVIKYRRQGSNDMWTEREVSPPDTYLIVNASEAYEPFEVVVMSQNDYGDGPISPAIIGHSGEDFPGTSPQGVHVEAISASEVNVTWQPISEEEANGELLGYVIHYNVRIASGQNELRCPTSPCILGGLRASTEYELTVSAYNSIGSGPPSETVTVVTGAAPVVPMAPGPVTMKVDAYSYRLVVDWDEPLERNGEILRYEITYSPIDEDGNGIGDTTNISQGVDKPTHLRIEEGIEPETKYRVTVLAVNDVGKGIKDVNEINTKLGGVPSKPRKPLFNGIGKDNVNVTWDVTANNPTAHKIAVQHKLAGDPDSAYNTSEPVDVHDGNEIMVSHLASSTEYMFRLKSTNRAGDTYSDTITTKTIGTEKVVNDGFVMGTWLIALICIIILLILILLIICIIKSQKGGKYNVSDKEKQLMKNDIESTPLKDDGFDEYRPPTGPDGEPLRGSQGSLVDSEPGSSESDSLKEYADGETGKFDEEGSFIGQYGDNKKQRPPEEGDQGGAAYSTFV